MVVKSRKLRRSGAKAPNRKPGLFGTIVLAMSLGAGIALAYNHFMPPPERPLPAAGKVIKVDLGMGTCADLSACTSACEGGQAEMCRALGASYAFGRAPAEKDEVRATRLYERACELGDAAGCLFAGQMYEYAHGVIKDDARATGLYQKACDVGWAPGCYNLAIMIEAGRGVPADRVRALALYRGACQAGAKQACEKVDLP